MHGGHCLVMWSVMREVRDLSSCESEFHGKESGADRELTKTLAVHCDAVASGMVQRLGARKHCNVEVKLLWLPQAMVEIELWNDVMWILMNLMGMNLVAWVECLVQQPREKITGTLIPDRGVEHEKRNCIDPMKWWGQRPSRQ